MIVARSLEEQDRGISQEMGQWKQEVETIKQEATSQEMQVASRS